MTAPRTTPRGRKRTNDGRTRAALLGALAAPLFFALPAAAGVPGAPCPVFPADNVWNTDISSLPVHPLGAAWLNSSGGPSRRLHPDFGPSGDPNVPYGIPFAVVDPSHPRTSVSFQYASESDQVPYPLGPDTPIEGGASSTGDRHALMIDRGSCTLYELYDTHYAPAGSSAGSGAVFDLRANHLRPAGWTSADAAGLPIFPGLLRLDEVNSGAVNHAVRFTVQRTAGSFVWPARHQAGSGSETVVPPMGARFRMKAGVDLSRFSGQAQVILTAFKHYGLILADNGSNWYVQGDANNAWPNALLDELKQVPAGDFEAVDEASLMLAPDSAQARQPGGSAPVAAAAPPPDPGPAPAPLPAAAPPLSGPVPTTPLQAADGARPPGAPPDRVAAAAADSPFAARVLERDGRVPDRDVLEAPIAALSVDAPIHAGRPAGSRTRGGTWWGPGLGIAGIALLLLTALGLRNRLHQ